MPVSRSLIGARWAAGRGLGIAVFLAAALLLGNASAVWAHEGHGHPARIHEGTCEALGPVAFRLTGVGANVDLDGAPVATPEAINPDSAYQVMVSETAIESTLEENMAGPYAVMIYESDDEMDAISCGNVGGALLEDSLIVGLAEAGVPGHLGFALFEPQGEQVLVSVILGHAMAPVSASGAVADHDHAADEEGHSHDADDAEHNDAPEEDDDHDAIATPAA